MDSILKVPKQPLYKRFMRDKKGWILACTLAPVTNHLGVGIPPKPITRHLTLKEGAIGSEKIMSLCVGTGIDMHVWYSASLRGY